MRVLDVPRGVRQQELRCAARAEPHGRAAARLLDVPCAVQPEELHCAARAEPHGREAVRLLDVPRVVQPTETTYNFSIYQCHSGAEMWYFFKKVARQQV